MATALIALERALLEPALRAWRGFPAQLLDEGWVGVCAPAGSAERAALPEVRLPALPMADGDDWTPCLQPMPPQPERAA